MSGRELAADGTDTYHEHHPWEQAGHPQYVAPRMRTRQNWPPVLARPVGRVEQEEWDSLPSGITPVPASLYGPGIRPVAVGDVTPEQVLADDKRRALAALQRIEDEARIDAVRFLHDGLRRQRALDKASDMALARDVVNGRWI